VTTRPTRRVGVQLPEVERVVRWDELRRMAVLAETCEFDSLWVGDHFLYRSGDGPRGPWEAWTQLAAIAAVTTTIEIGPLVAALAFHEPAMLAKLAWTVDEISGGRLVLGVGAGWNEAEFRALGIPFERRVGRFGEGFDIVRRLVAGQTVTHHGAFYDIEECVLLPPSRRERPMPLMVGSTGPRVLAITLPHVHAWNSWFTEFDNLPERVPALVDRFDAACARAGRDPAEIEKSVAVLLDFGSQSPRNGTVNPMTGTPQEIAGELAKIFDAGIDHVQLVLDPITEASIERAAVVAAAVRA
jgi:alkanesulfonate monooxygenase SsuD/methylene tetrahydromethanopterin reductase-like flavin-dependent oxidoreductase (luciferase family)